MAQGPRRLNLMTIWITIQIQESEVRNPDSLDYHYLDPGNPDP